MYSLFKDRKAFPKVTLIRPNAKIKGTLLFKPEKLNHLRNLKLGNSNFISRYSTQKNSFSSLNNKQKNNNSTAIFDPYLELIIKKYNKKLLDTYKSPYIKHLLNKKPFNISSIKESDKPRFFYYFLPCYILEQKKCALTAKYNDYLLIYDQQEYLTNYYKENDAKTILKYLLYVKYNMDPLVINKYEKCNIIIKKTQFIINNYNGIILTNNNYLNNSIKPILSKIIKYFYIKEIPQKNISNIIPNYYAQSVEILLSLKNFIKYRKHLKINNISKQEKETKNKIKREKEKEKKNEIERERIKENGNEGNNIEISSSTNDNNFFNSILSYSSSNIDNTKKLSNNKDDNKSNKILNKRVRNDKEIIEIERIIGDIIKEDEKKHKKIKSKNDLINRALIKSKTKNNEIFISSLNHPIAIKKKNKDINKNKTYSNKKPYFNKYSPHKNKKKCVIKHLKEKEELNCSRKSKKF